MSFDSTIMTCLVSRRCNTFQSQIPPSETDFLRKTKFSWKKNILNGADDFRRREKFKQKVIVKKLNCF